MIATKSRKLSRKYNTPMESNHRASLMGHLTHNRNALAGKYENYDVRLGNRKSALRRDNAKLVIRLVMGMI
jgi:hypothetical protein